MRPGETEQRSPLILIAYTELGAHLDVDGVLFFALDVECGLDRNTQAVALKG